MLRRHPRYLLASRPVGGSRKRLARIAAGAGPAGVSWEGEAGPRGGPKVPPRPPYLAHLWDHTTARQGTMERLSFSAGEGCSATLGASDAARALYSAGGGGYSDTACLLSSLMGCRDLRTGDQCGRVWSNRALAQHGGARWKWSPPLAGDANCSHASLTCRCDPLLQRPTFCCAVSSHSFQDAKGLPPSRDCAASSLSSLSTTGQAACLAHLELLGPQSPCCTPIAAPPRSDRS